MRAAVLGLGSWGTALAVHLARGGHEVRGWTHDPVQRDHLRVDRENRKYLPEIRFPDSIQVVDELEGAAAGADVVVLAVPTFALRGIAGAVAGALPAGAPVVNTAKGLEEGTEVLPLVVLAQELGGRGRTVSLVGPSHAEEVARDHPTAVVAASADPEAARLTQECFGSDTFRVYTNPDVLGVELAAALKNVIALAAGIARGLGFGDNTLGALVTRGVAEMTRLGVHLGARAETFFGLSGVGDVVTTCVSTHSRNRRVGEALGRGESLDDVLAGMTMVAEGVRTTRAARGLAARTGIEMPIVTEVHGVLFEGVSPAEGIRSLMTREPKAEFPHDREQEGRQG